MNTPHVLMPRQPVPALDVPLLGGGRFDLAVSPAPTFSMPVFYRGLHCPLCAKYLLELEKLHDEFVRPDGTLYWGSTQTMPFARPHFDEILGALDFVAKNDYPARGEYLGPV